MRYLFLGFVLLAGACSPLLNPSPEPRGYTYLNDKYKSPPGPEAHKMGYDYTHDRNALVQEEWQRITRDLVVYMEQKTSITPRAIHLSDILPPSAFNQTYDYTLRQALRERGYTLLTNADPYPIRITYEAIPLSEDKDFVHFTDFQDYKPWAPYDLVLKIYAGQKDPIVVKKSYNVPAYGYSAGSYIPEEEKPVKPRMRPVFEMLGENE